VLITTDLSPTRRHRHPAGSTPAARGFDDKLAGARRPCGAPRSGLKLLLLGHGGGHSRVLSSSVSRVSVCQAHRTSRSRRRPRRRRPGAQRGSEGPPAEAPATPARGPQREDGPVKSCRSLLLAGVGQCRRCSHAITSNSSRHWQRAAASRIKAQREAEASHRPWHTVPSYSRSSRYLRSHTSADEKRRYRIQRSYYSYCT
jgi:hypothetical protein